MTAPNPKAKKSAPNPKAKKSAPNPKAPDSAREPEILDQETESSPDASTEESVAAAAKQGSKIFGTPRVMKLNQK